MPTPIATWNPARGVWETQVTSLLCEHSELFSETWPTSGMTRRGTALPLPASEHRTDGSGCSSSPGRNLATPTASISKGGRPQDSRGKRDLRLDLLPTPTKSDGTGGPGNSGRDGGDNLRTAVAYLPTPTARDWRSGQASPETMGHNARPLSEGGPNQRGSSGDLMLPSAVVQLLPTPVAGDSERGSKTYARGNPTLLGAVTRGDSSSQPSDDGSD